MKLKITIKEAKTLTKILTHFTESIQYELESLIDSKKDGGGGFDDDMLAALYSIAICFLPYIISDLTRSLEEYKEVEPEEPIAISCPESFGLVLINLNIYYKERKYKSSLNDLKSDINRMNKSLERLIEPNCLDELIEKILKLNFMNFIHSVKPDEPANDDRKLKNN